MKMVIGAACFLVLVLSITVSADTLRFEIRDLSDQPIPDVTISYSYNATPPAAPGSGTLMTDSNGRVTLAHPGLGGSACILFSSMIYSISKPDFQFAQTGGVLSCGPLTYDLKVIGTGLPPMTSVSAAGYESRLAPEMLAAAFGPDLATFSEFASVENETTLANRSILIKDAQGVEKTADLIFVSPGQINYVIPAGLSEGTATFRLLGADGTSIKAEFARLSTLAPGVFAANANGQGITTGYVVRVRPGNVQTLEPVTRYDQAEGKFVPVPIDLGTEAESVFLVLFGTGWRNAASLSSVSVTIGGVASPVQYAGKQPTNDGLDQINALLPRELAGRGDVTIEVRVSGLPANVVHASVK
jgi:uncharacterized protein (TIGR03437 family)